MTGSGKLHIENGAIKNGRGDVLMTLTEALNKVCIKRSGAPVIAMGEYRPAAVMLDSTGYGNLAPTYPFGVQAAEVEVDETTGKIIVKKIVAVHDSGRIFNPQMAAGGVYGGVAQAFGFAMMEQLGINNQGLLHGGTLLEYKMPTMLDVPELVVDLLRPKIRTDRMAQRRWENRPSCRCYPPLPMRCMTPSAYVWMMHPLHPRRCFRQSRNEIVKLCERIRRAEHNENCCVCKTGTQHHGSQDRS